MLSERQRNIFVELTPPGRTDQYIADKFDCSISTILRIRKGHGETDKDCHVVIVQRRPQPVMSAIPERL